MRPHIYSITLLSSIIIASTLFASPALANEIERADTPLPNHQSDAVTPDINIETLSQALANQQQSDNAAGAPSNGAAGPPDNIPDPNGDFLLIGIGVGITTDYAGADNYDFLPVPQALGSYKGIGFISRGPGLAFDFIPDKKDAKVDLIFGPQFRFRFDRNNSDNIEDAQVAALEELDTAVELGVSAGFQVNKLLSDFDNVTVWVDALWDVAGAHGGAFISPAVTYSTPLSTGIVARLSTGITYVSDDFVDTYSSINAANSLASGLPTFQGEGGIRDVNGSLLMAFDLDGDVRNGGWSIFALGNYSRLLGDTADSPIVTETGSPNQFFGALGIGYSF